jgi:hypothetical protein
LESHKEVIANLTNFYKPTKNKENEKDSSIRTRQSRSGKRM